MQMGYVPVPITSQNLCRYAVYLSVFKKLNPSSLPKYLNIVRLLHIECGLPNPLGSNWYLDSVLRGIKRVNASPPKRKLPISPQILVHLRRLLNFDCPLHIIFWAACLVMFFGLFRKSNVLAPATRFDPSRHLCRSDVIVHAWGLEVRIKWSKTVQFHERTCSVPLPYIPGHPLCPTTAVINAFNISKSAPLDGPALTYPTLAGVQPLRYPHFIKLLRSFLSQVGLPAHDFAGHSFRRGGASFALQAGLPGEIIMQLGQWSSDAYRQYLDVPLGFKAKCMAQFAKALAS